MEITAEFKQNWKEDKLKLKNEISSLRKLLANYKEERKSEWRSFKTKLNDELDEVEKSLKKLPTLHRK